MDDRAGIPAGPVVLDRHDSRRTISAALDIDAVTGAVLGKTVER